MVHKARRGNGRQDRGHQRGMRVVHRCNDALDQAKREAEQTRLGAANGAAALQETLDEAVRTADAEGRRCRLLRKELVNDQEGKEAVQAELAAKEDKITEPIASQNTRKLEMKGVVERQAEAQARADEYKYKLFQSKDTSDKLKAKIASPQSEIDGPVDDEAGASSAGRPVPGTGVAFYRADGDPNDPRVFTKRITKRATLQGDLQKAQGELKSVADGMKDMTIDLSNARLRLSGAERGASRIRTQLRRTNRELEKVKSQNEEDQLAIQRLRDGLAASQEELPSAETIREQAVTIQRRIDIRD